MKSSPASCSARLLGCGDSATVSALLSRGSCSSCHNAVGGSSVTAAAVATARTTLCLASVGEKVSQRCKMRASLSVETPLFRFRISYSPQVLPAWPDLRSRDRRQALPGRRFRRGGLRRELSRFGGTATRLSVRPWCASHVSRDGSTAALELYEERHTEQADLSTVRMLKSVGRPSNGCPGSTADDADPGLATAAHKKRRTSTTTRRKGVARGDRGSVCFCAVAARVLEGLQVGANALVERQWGACELRDIEPSVRRFGERELLAGRRRFAGPLQEEIAARGRYE